MTRGIRNNNPGNIRHGDAWRGLAESKDAEFCTFIAPVYGIRAMVKILGNYRKRGLDTVREIINAWAPPIENDTGAYVKSVANRCMVAPDDRLAWTPNTIALLVKAIIQHENGSQPYSDNTINDGVTMGISK